MSGWRGGRWESPFPGCGRALVAILAVLGLHFVIRIRNAPEEVGLPTAEEQEGGQTQARGVETDELLGFAYTLRQTVANPVVMHRTMTAVHAANICMWLKRDLKYDPVKEEFINDPEADKKRARALRAPWRL